MDEEENFGMRHAPSPSLGYTYVKCIRLIHKLGKLCGKLKENTPLWEIASRTNLAFLLQTA